MIDRTKEVRMMNCGKKARIIEYRNSKDIDIKFEDGKIIKHKTYTNFKNGKIAYNSIEKKSRKDEERMMNCGKVAKIIEYRNNVDIDVEFKDGAIAEHKTYANFLLGKIAYPSETSKEKRKNEERMMNCGMKARIIEYRNCEDIDIKFEDKAIVRHKSYKHFKSGQIAHPEIKIAGISFNEIILMYYLSKIGFIKINRGQFKDLGFGSMELDCYNPDINGKKIAIEYDGFNHIISKDKNKDKVCKQNNIHLIRIREPITPKYKSTAKMFILSSSERMSESLKSTIYSVIEYINKLCNTDFSLDIDFTRDEPDFYKIYNKSSTVSQRLGQVRVMNCGLMAKIEKYRTCQDIDVKFIDNTIVKHKRYANFLAGKIAYPDKNKLEELKKIYHISQEKQKCA